MSDAIAQAAGQPEAHAKKRGIRPIRVIGFVLLSLAVVIMLAWSFGAICYSNLPGAALRTVVAAAFSGGFLLAFLFVRRRARTLRYFLIAFCVLLLWWFNIPPSNDRDWAVEAGVVPRVTFEDDRVHIENLRNFHYRTNDDFDVRYENRTYDLSKLRSVDFIVSHFGVEEIAHTFLSFGFEPDVYLAISIEVRKEKGEDYTPLKGIFKQYELIYIVGDERDLIRLRTNLRDEDVYLYRVRSELEHLRTKFLDYLRRVDELAGRPEFYNTLTSNCTTNLLRHANAAPPYHSWNWEILFNGYSDRYAYHAGAIDTDLPFDELKKRCRINDAAKAAGDSPDFSRLIRGHLPGIDDRASGRRAARLDTQPPR